MKRKTKKKKGITTTELVIGAGAGIGILSIVFIGLAFVAIGGSLLDGGV